MAVQQCVNICTTSVKSIAKLPSTDKFVTEKFARSHILLYTTEKDVTKSGDKSKHFVLHEHLQPYKATDTGKLHNDTTLPVAATRLT